MLWIRSHRRMWRIIFLTILLVAIIGPWAYDRINVPSIYPCGDGWFRLEGDFCGSPLPGTRLFTFGLEAFSTSIQRMIAGEAQLRWEIQNFSFGILVLLVFLPLLSLLRMSIREADKKLRRRHLLILGLAVLIVVPYAFVGFLSFNWMSWGIWLYLGVLICVLFFEVLNYLQGRKTGSPALVSTV